MEVGANSVLRSSNSSLQVRITALAIVGLWSPVANSCTQPL